MNIYQRINEVRKSVRHVRKDSAVRAGAESYQAVSHDAVTSAVRDAMVEHGVLCLPSLIDADIAEAGATKRGTPIIRYQARYNVSFVNVDEPTDRVEIVVSAHANDMGDKAPGKALSYAAKSAMLKVFTLETGDDDESRVDPEAKGGNFDSLMAHNGAVRECMASIAAIKRGLEAEDWDSAAESWAELTRKEERALWLAPSKGGIFTTAEREAIKGAEFVLALKTRRTDSGWYDNPENQL